MWERVEDNEIRKDGQRFCQIVKLESRVIKQEVDIGRILNKVGKKNIVTYKIWIINVKKD